uniref:Uncharacterized protein n=1 Tax=Nelumbo nucifera TaxID=4432 RepID=A0A822YQI5_NELNU|nr:TPA_asm: hypothetical protein HUJ06_012712 [Nelumbo nucifera]
MDKAAILSDVVRMVTQLQSEAQKLKESNESLLEKIKELKAEKNELGDEKQRLKTEKLREAGTASQKSECSTKLSTSPYDYPSCIYCPRPSCW